MIDTSKGKAFTHLKNVTSSYGVNLDQPMMAIKGDYYIRFYYLGQEVFYINTKPFDIKIDDLYKKECKVKNDKI